MVPYGKIFSYFINISDKVEIFSYYSGIFYKTLEILICNHLIIHNWSFYKNILDILFQKYANMLLSEV